MTGLNLRIHRKEFHFGVDGLDHGCPRLDFIPASVVAQIHDGVPQMNAVALIVAVLEQGVELTAQACSGHFDVEPGEASDVQVVLKGSDTHTGPDEASGNTVVLPSVLVMSVPISNTISVVLSEG